MIPCTPPCVVVAKGRLPDAKAGSQTGLPRWSDCHYTGGHRGGPTATVLEATDQTDRRGGPTASRSRVAAWPCASPVAASNTASTMDVGGRPPRWLRTSSPACMRYYNAVRTLSTGTRCTTAHSRYSAHCWRRTTSPHRRQAKTSNLLLHDDTRVMMWPDQ
jgi:hypothetical protein